MQIQMRDIATELTRCAQADHGVEVGAVNIDLSTVLVHDVADVGDAFLKHAVCGRIGNHQRGEIGAVCFGFGFEVDDVDIAACVTVHDDDAHADHAGGGGIGAVCG